MAELGTMALLIGLGVTTYSLLGSVIGVKIGLPELIVSSRRALYMSILSASVASTALITAFVQNEFAIKYVADHSNTIMDRAYVWVAFYSGNEGSLLYIVLILSIISAISVRFAPKQLARSIPSVSYTHLTLPTNREV